MNFHMHPRSQAAYREKTHGKTSMATASFDAFICKCCGERKPMKGRKQIAPKQGYKCAECAA